MNLSLGKEFEELAKKDSSVVAVLVFGSHARQEPNARDIDVCIVLDKKYPNIEMSKKRLKYLSKISSKFDIQIFQQLPIYIRKRILKEGKVIFCNNEDKLYEIAYETIKEFVFFEKYYKDYLASVKNG